MRLRVTARRVVLSSLLLTIALLLTIHPPAVLAATGGQGTVIHVVRRGETLSGIATRYGVSEADIMRVNNISNRHRIYAGQRLKIPARVSGSDRRATGPSLNICYIHKVRWGETLSGIALRYGVTVESIKQANGLLSFVIFPGRKYKIPCPRTFIPHLRADGSSSTDRSCSLIGGKYRVQKGDTLSKIARRCDVTVAAIQSANNLSGTRIYAGQWLIIPTNPSPSKPRPTMTPVPVATVEGPTQLPPSVLSGTPTPTPTPTPTRVPIRSTKVPTYTPTPAK